MTYILFYFITHRLLKSFTHYMVKKSTNFIPHPLGLQGVQWAVGLVVVHASWPGHPRKSKKKNIYDFQAREVVP
jgi:hypothetical protein